MIGIPNFPQTFYIFWNHNKMILAAKGTLRSRLCYRQGSHDSYTRNVIFTIFSAKYMTVTFDKLISLMVLFETYITIQDQYFKNKSQ